MRRSVARFLLGAPLVPGTTATLDTDAAQHIRVLRLRTGARVELLDGVGRRGAGTLTHVDRSSAVVAVDEVTAIAPAPAVHMIVPVADRERMLWLAEKCTELAATTWRPVLWNRSASVSPRGTGAAFMAKVRARMGAALVQSGNAWLPGVYAEQTLAEVIAQLPSRGTRIVLDPRGPALLRGGPCALEPPLTIAVGPEGGVEDAEQAQLAASGFIPASLGATILRFETAGVAALGALRAGALEGGK